MPRKSHKWKFPTYFRANVYAWHGSQKASKRIKETISEIKRLHKKEPEVACEGIVRFIEKLSPALSHIDSSSGQIGNAVYNAIEILAPIFAGTEIEFKTREKWMTRLWVAYDDDDIPYLDNLGDHFGAMCREETICNAWAGEFIDITKSALRRDVSYFKGTVVCLSCLLQAKRYEELLALLEQDENGFWHYRQYGVRALAALGKVDEAIAYAHQSKGLNDPQWLIDQACERMLLAAGRVDEAYGYALTSESKTTNLATFRAIAKKYPDKDRRDILNDLIERSGDNGKWFATAKQIGEFDLAIELISEHPCDPLTINRAARDFQDKNSTFALKCALSSLHWMAEGYGYELTGLDVLNAFGYAMEIAKRHNIADQVMGDIKKIIEGDTTGFVKRILEQKVV